MLTLEGYDRADLQPHAGALRTKLLRLKADSAFVPKAGEKLSRKTIEARIRVFQNSIYAVIGSQRHAFQPRLFSPELKVGRMLLCITRKGVNVVLLITTSRLYALQRVFCIIKNYIGCCWPVIVMPQIRSCNLL